MKKNLSDFEVQKANAHSLRSREKGVNVHAKSVRYLYADHALMFAFSDGSAVLVPVDHYSELQKWTMKELDSLTIGFDGAVLCLDSKNINVSIASLLAALPSLSRMAIALVSARHDLLRPNRKPPHQ